uniref:Uncharacterized protein n=1 Tax=Magallana gigas TaxID=29159 RepID=K1QYM6_MAGGI
MSLEKKVIDPPSIGDYLHGYTLSYKSYGSLWQLLGTGAWFWTRENEKVHENCDLFQLSKSYGRLSTTQTK